MIEQQKVNLSVNEEGEEELQTMVVANAEQKPRNKKQRSPYMIFMIENADKYKNLGKNFLKEISRIWNELDDDVKKIYIEKSRAEKDAIVADMSDIQGSMVVVPRSKFPVSKIKNIAKEDPQLYKKIRPETFEYLAEIVEIFSTDLLSDAYGICKRNGKRKITENIFDDVRKKNYKYRFLSDLKMHAKEAKKTDHSGDKNNIVEEEEEEEELEMAPEEIAEVPHNNTLMNYFKK